MNPPIETRYTLRHTSLHDQLSAPGVYRFRQARKIQTRLKLDYQVQ